MPTSYGQPYWSRREKAAPKSKRAPLKGAQKTDVVVIGAGLTGCATAYLLAKAGLDVVVVEAETIGSGSTSRGMGAIVPSLDVSLIDGSKAAGAKPARVMYRELRRSARDLVATIPKLGISCDLDDSQLLVNAPFTNDAAQLKKEVSARKSASLDAVWVPPAGAREALLTETQGAMRVKGVSTFDPVKAARGFAALAAKKGATFFEHSRAKKTTFTRKEVTVVLQGATLTARGVVVATGEPGAVFHQLERHVRTTRGYVVVTDRLTPAMKRATGDRDALYTEFTESPRWLRWLDDDRAMFGGLSAAPVKAALHEKAVIQRSNQLMYELSLRYPDLSGLPPAFGWDVPIVTTADGLPWIGPHRNYPFHFFALAFGWHGDVLGWLAAQAAARYFTDKTSPDDTQLGFARAL